MGSCGSGWEVCYCWSSSSFTYWSYTSPDNVICNITVYADDTTLYFRYDQAADLQQQLRLVSELKSELQDTVDCGRK